MPGCKAAVATLSPILPRGPACPVFGRLHRWAGATMDDTMGGAATATTGATTGAPTDATMGATMDATTGAVMGARVGTRMQ